MRALGCSMFGAFAFAMALGALGCEGIAGVDDYTVGSPEGRADPAAIAAFLAGETACADCVLASCGAEVLECAADAACARPALCMGSCTVPGTRSTDPACVLTRCSGASEPRGRFSVLTDCAVRHCPDQCEIGRSWGCAGKYDWPRVGTEPVPTRLKMYLFTTNRPWVGADFRLCDDRSDSGQTACEASWMLDSSRTDAEGFVTLTATPSLGLGRPSLPPAYFYVDPSHSEDGVETLPYLIRLGPKIVPFVDSLTLPVLWSGEGSLYGGGSRFINGITFDCRGSRVMAGAGLKARFNPPAPCCRDGAAFGGFWIYWDGEQETPHGEPDARTFLSGVFTHFELPQPGIYTLELVDAEAPDVVRASFKNLKIPVDFDGVMGILVFPPTAAEALGQ